MNRLRFALSRDVKMPQRAGEHEAGIDFFVPNKLYKDDILKANVNISGINIIKSDHYWPSGNNVYLNCDDQGKVNSIILGAWSRIIIPSGVHALIEPWDSALIAANKSGIATKKGLIFGAQVVDSTYTGEIHISIINPGEIPQVLKPGEKAIQFIHTPVLLTRIENINWDGVGGFLDISEGWSDRGSNWQGSSNKVNEIEPYNDGVKS